MKIQCKLPAMSLAIWVLLTSALQAETVLDGSLGREGSFSGNFTITHDMGELSPEKNNLFHSFKSFNINTGESATFTGPDSVMNVISRVTGGKGSWIDGTISSTMPHANFYLLNSNGIVFGENASLDVQGSFHASTADYLQLEDGQRFYASLSSDSSFTVASPSRFGFLDNPDSPTTGITINGSFLRVNAEKTLSLVGGDLNLNDGMLYAPDGKINLVSVASAGEVIPGLFNSAENLGTIIISGVERPKIEDSEEIGNIDTTGINGGKIFIQSGQFISVGGHIISDVTPDESLVRYDANQRGKITILAKEMIGLMLSDISTDARENTNHDAGNILIETPTMEFYAGCDGCGISSDTYGSGNGGNIHITASDSLSIFGGIISVASAQIGTGNAGHIDLEVGKLVLEAGGNINSGTLGSGDGGNIDINATQAVSLTGSIIASSVGDDKIIASGKGGNIFIKTPRLDIIDGSAVQTGAFEDSIGDAGDISINADYLKLDNISTIISSSGGSGRSGNIVISSIDTELKQNSSIMSSSVSNTNGGNITANVGSRLYLDNSGIIANAMGRESQGNGGNITIKNPQFFILGKSNILAGAENGKGGSISIDADHFIHSYPYKEGGNIPDVPFEILKIIYGIVFDSDKKESRVNASSNFGQDGEVWINASEEDITKGLIKLNDEPLDINLSIDRCAGFGKEELSKFIITIRDVLPPTPEDLRM